MKQQVLERRRQTEVERAAVDEDGIAVGEHEVGGAPRRCRAGGDRGSGDGERGAVRPSEKGVGPHQVVQPLTGELEVRAQQRWVAPDHRGGRRAEVGVEANHVRLAARPPGLEFVED